MKKLALLFLAVCVLPVVCGAWPMNWSSSSAIWVPNGSGGTKLWPETDSGYTFALYLSGDNQFNPGTDVLCLQQDGRDVGGGGSTFSFGGDSVSDTLVSIPLISDPTYDYLVTVMYIGTPSTYTYYAVLGNGAALPTVTPDPANQYYDIVPGVSQANVYTTFVAVPEPSTIGLLLVGAGLVAFRRMRRS
jgi:hypothetical protein